MVEGISSRVILYEVPAVSEKILFTEASGFDGYSLGKEAYKFISGELRLWTYDDKNTKETSNVNAYCKGENFELTQVLFLN